MSNIKQGKRALLIGIDDYPAFSAEDQLDGAVADARALADLLVESFGFAKGAVELLTNEQATREGIIGALGRLLERTRPDDVVVVHYSGHGSQRFDPSGREADGLEEVLVPSNSGHTGPYLNKGLGSRELYAWLRHLSAITRRVTLSFDCCHAGTITRELHAGRQRWLEEDRRASSPLPFPWRLDDFRLPAKGQSGWFPVSESYTLLAACRSDESANELMLSMSSGTAHGALTYFLLRELEKAAAGTTYRDLMERVTAEVTARFPGQHPQLEGAGDRVLFQLEELRPMRHHRVRQRQGDRLVLTCGTVHGVQEGSIWTAYPQRTKTPREEDRLGQIEVTAVRGVHSDSEVRQETSPGAIGEGCRVVLHSLPQGAVSLMVAVEASQDQTSRGATLRRCIEGSPLLSLTLTPEEADLRVYLLDPRPRRHRGGPAPMLGALERPVCAVLDREGEVVLPVHDLDGSFSPEITLENLEGYASLRSIQALEPPQDNPLAGKVGFRVLRRKEGGGWVPVEPSWRNGPLVFRDEEDFAVELFNQHDERVFPYLLDLGLGGRVDLIYPFSGSWEPLEAGQTILLGDRLGEELTFYVPETFPFYAPGSRPEFGIQDLKLLATTEEVDLRPLFQPLYRDRPGWRAELAGSSLGRLLARLCLGDPLREVRRGRSTQNISWTSVKIPVLLRRQ